MNEIKVTVELSDKTNALLLDILDELRNRHSPYETIVGHTELAEMDAPMEPVKERPQTEPKPEPQTEPEPEPQQQAAPSVTVADLQSKFVQLVGLGKRDAAVKTIKGYAERISLIPEDKLEEVMDKLSALVG